MKTESNTVPLLPLVFIAIGLFLFANKSFAQQDFAPGDVARLELVTRSGGLSNGLLEVEVVKEKNGWNSYQTKLVRGQLESSSRTFIKEVPVEELNQLLATVAKQDSVKNIKQFGIKASELIQYIDSIDVAISSEVRKDFIEILKNESVVNQAFSKVTEPVILDDRTYYGITFMMKDGTSFTIKAYSFADFYYLPWYIGKTKSYDPAISVIFESIVGNDMFPNSQKDGLNRRLVQHVYWQHLHKK